MTNYNPTSQEIYALQRVYAIPGETHPNDIPRSVMNDCVRKGWVTEFRDGYHMTPEGEAVWRARR